MSADFGDTFEADDADDGVATISLELDSGHFIATIYNGEKSAEIVLSPTTGLALSQWLHRRV